MGIPISIDPSWLIIFGVLTYLLATRVFPFELRYGFRRGPGLLPLALAVITSLLLFASVLAHELSHAWMAVRRGIPVLGITLFIFGGVAQIGDEADRPLTEFLVAIMGPLMSLALALVFGAAWVWSMALMSLARGAFVVLLPLGVATSYLAASNLILVLFNLLPGFPLDGGRVLRAILWSATGDVRRATHVAALIGRGIAVLLALVGVWTVVRAGFDGIWTVLIAIFLWQAAGEAYRSVLLREALDKVSISSLMRLPSGSVPGDLSVLSFVEHYLLPARGAVFAIEEDGRRIGLIGGSQVRDIPRDKWGGLHVRDTMLLPSPVYSISPDESALRALLRLSRPDAENLSELPVVSEGRLVGVVGNDEIARYLQERAM